MELTQPNEDIQPLQVDSLIWSEPSHHSYSLNQPPLRLFTASKNLKSAYILSHIKPDYGSLGEFMKDVGISKDILLHNRKKKLDQQEDLQQKRMRTTLRGKNLQKVIRQEGTVLEKITASKMIVENLFQKNFGNTISNFCSQNSRQDSNKVSYSSINSFADMLDQMMSKQKQERSVHRESKQELPFLTRNKHLLSSKEIKIVGMRERLEKIREVKAFYPSLKKYAVQLNQISDDRDQTRAFESTFQINKSNSSLAALIQYIRQIKIEEIRRIKVTSTPITDDLLCFILDFFSQIRNSNIFQLILEDIKFSNNQKMSAKIKEFIEKTNMNKAFLQRIGLKSKDFCVICLGIGTKASFDYLSLRENEIGEPAIKCLDVLMKFHKNTQFDFIGNPLQKELRGKAAYKRCLMPRSIQ